MALGGASAALAAGDIGKAVSIAPSVSGTAQGRSKALGTGDGVVQNELIRTAASGNAQLRFIDATDLSIGPSSAVKLDRFVFDPGGGAKSFVLNATKGAFRFATGNSNHEAYQIRTPAAVIGVRGTSFEFSIDGKRLTLKVFSGTVVVCPLGLSKASCYEATPGQTIVARPGRPVVVVSTQAPPPDTGTPPLPPPTILTWSGCHVTASTSYSRSQGGPTRIIPVDDGIGRGTRNKRRTGLAVSQRLGNVPRLLPSARAGAGAGGGFGCDIQLASVLVGLESEMAYTDLGRTAQVTGGPARVTTTDRQNQSFAGTTRVRVGWVFGPALVYGTGGLAYGNVATRASIVPPRSVFGQTLAGSESAIRVGWAFGAGVGYALGPHWSAKLEYLHTDLGDSASTTPTVAGPPPRETGIFRTANRTNLVRVGAEYRF